MFSITVSDNLTLTNFMHSIINLSICELFLYRMDKLIHF